MQRSVDRLQVLLRGRHREQRIIANTVWLMLAFGLSGVADFFIAVYVTRVFGATQYGTFVFAFAFASLFSAFFDFGLAMAVTREFARDQDRSSELADLLLLKGLLGAAVLVPITVGALLFSPSGPVRLLILALSVHIFQVEGLNLLYAYFRSRQRMDLEARFRFLYVLMLGLLVVGGVSTIPSVLTLALAYTGASLMTLLVLLGTLVREGALTAPPRVNPAVWRQFLKIGGYLALTKIAGDVIAYTAPVLLGALGRLAETGWYNAATKINGLVLFPMSLIASAIFPALVGIRAESEEEFRRYWTRWAKGTVVLSVLLCAVVISKAAGIIGIVYPPDFAPAAAVLRVLIFVAVLTYVQALYYHGLLIFDEQRRVFQTVLVAGVASLVLNALLIPRFGPTGAAWALVFTHALILLQYLMVGSRHASLRAGSVELLTTAAMAVTAGGVMLLGLFLLRVVVTNLFLSVAAGIVIYATSLAILTVARRTVVGLRV